jgi:hypothetical protein
VPHYLGDLTLSMYNVQGLVNKKNPINTNNKKNPIERHVSGQLDSQCRNRMQGRSGRASSIDSMKLSDGGSNSNSEERK